MANLKPGDSVLCHLKEDIIVNPSSDYDDTKRFDIIANEKNGYYLFISPFVFIKNTITINNTLIKQLNLHKKYLNDSTIYIDENLVFKVASQIDGSVCDRCKEFSYKASPDKDGSFFCWSCKDNPFR